MKQVTQQLTFKETDGIFISIEARNYNSHLLVVTHAGSNVRVPTSVNEMRRMALFLNTSADEIERDDDFKNTDKQTKITSL